MTWSLPSRLHFQPVLPIFWLIVIFLFGTQISIKVGLFVVESLSHVWLFVTSWTAAHQTSLSFTISQSSLKLMSIESVLPSDHLIFCRPFLLLPSIFPSIRVISHQLALCHRWLKYWSFSFSVSPSNEYSELVSFRMLLNNLQHSGTVLTPFPPWQRINQPQMPKMPRLRPPELHWRIEVSFKTGNM